jgi:hypothetical protein
MSIAEPTTIGLSESAHEKLKRLQEEQHFRELLDGYRFAIGLALAQGVEPPEVQKRTTIFNVGTVDPDQSLKRSIEALMGDRVRDASIYKMAERLAEWGVNELASQAESGSIDFAGLLDQAGEREAADS